MALPAVSLVGGSVRVDGRTPDRVVTTHVSEVAFVGDLVVKRKHPVDLGFLDHRSLPSRERACRREVELNRRICPDVHLGVADVRDPDGRVVDHAVVMRRLPDDTRLSTRLRAGHDVGDCLRQVARTLAAFHAGADPVADPDRYASAVVVGRNWRDNLDVVTTAPGVDVARVEALDRTQRDWLAGRGELLADRARAGLVRDGHGDLLADDIFCLPDGPRVIDCLEFVDQYRYGDVLLDAAFLAMQLEHEGRPDLARAFLDAYGEFSDEHHPASLVHHFVAYRASVRAKVTALARTPDGMLTPDARDELDRLLDLCARHLDLARVRLVLVGGLPGTGKSTLATALSDRLGLALLRSDEVRKDLVGVAHHLAAPGTAYTRETTTATYTTLLDRARTLLAHGESVVLDATWPTEALRDVARRVADDTASEMVELTCVTDTATAHERLRRRTDDTSDADVAIHERLRASMEPWPAATRVPTDDATTAVSVATDAISRPRARSSP